jgi:hypothetical protein
MPKIIVDKSDFLAGFSTSEFIGPGYREGKFMNPFGVGSSSDMKFLGTLAPGRLGSKVASNSASINQLMSSIALRYDSVDSPQAYGIGVHASSAKIYQINPLDITVGTTGFPKSTNIANANYAGDIIHYWANQGSTKKEFMFFTGDNRLGKVRMSGTAYNMTANNYKLTASVEHPMSIHNGNNILYGVDGQYIWSYDGLSGANGTFNPSALDIKKPWTLNSITKWRDYTVVSGNKVAGNGGFVGEVAVFIWDMISPVPNYQVFINDPIVYGIFNLNDTLFTLTAGDIRSGIKVRKFDGDKFNIVGQLGYNYRNQVRPKSICSWNGMLCWQDIRGAWFVFGKFYPNLPEGIFCIGSANGWTTGGLAGGVMSYNNIIYSTYDEEGVSPIRLQWFPRNYQSSFFDFKTVWYEPERESNQMCQLKNVKIYFADVLASGMSKLSANAYINGGTSATLLGEVSYTALGAVMYVKFDRRIEFNTISIGLTNGGNTNTETETPKISKIEVEYDLIEAS